MQALNLQKINTVVYWKQMNELDIYIQDEAVTTLKGSWAETILNWLSNYKVDIEVVEWGYCNSRLKK